MCNSRGRSNFRVGPCRPRPRPRHIFLPFVSEKKKDVCFLFIFIFFRSLHGGYLLLSIGPIGLYALSIICRLYAGYMLRLY